METSIRKRMNIDIDWKFRLGDPAGAEAAQYDDNGWRSVSLPHDWSIEGDYEEGNPTGPRGAFLPAGIGWYRKTFEWSGDPAARRVFLSFDGVYMNSDVWINGKHLSLRPNGYIGFELDVTDAIMQGSNTVAVRVDNSLAPSGRWYTGCGIYRHVWLIETWDVHVEHWGTCITTPEASHDRAIVHIRTRIRNASSQPRNIQLHSSIHDDNGECSGETFVPHAIAPYESIELEQKLPLASPKLWSPDTPHVYGLHTVVTENGRELDDYATSFGVRFFSFDSDQGFALNGVPCLIRGVCQHHDGGPVGAAVPDKLLEKRLRLLKEMGCNAIRTGHHPMAPEFYHLCDRIGLMVMNEAFDGWAAAKAEYDYGLYFEKWWRRDLTDMMRRDRNHPCVIFWSLGNEVLDMEPDMTRAMVEFAHRLDDTRPVTCGVQQTGDVPDANRSELDIAGYNDGGGACFGYERDHANHPRRVMVATEAPHTFQTRGFYRTRTWWRDKNKPRIEIENLTEEELFSDGALAYNSSYDNSGVRTSARHSWGFVLKYPYLIGEFRWTGFDYLGESFGWPARSANFGIIDLANFPKDHYYFYQSRFTTKPMIHMLPHWTHPGLEGKAIPVWVYTNCEEAELRLNGRSLGRKRMGADMYLSWDVPYEPGTLSAIGYSGGVRLAEAAAATAGTPAMLRLEADGDELLADGADVRQVSVEVVDERGTMVPHAGHEIAYAIVGPARCLGTENGDPLDLTPSKSMNRKAFYGKCMALFQSTPEAGPVEVIVGGVLGELYFAASTTVSIVIERLPLRGECPRLAFEIRYTTDGSQPTSASALYEGPFEITASTLVKAIAMENGLENDSVALEMQSAFTRGEPPKVEDLTHGNEPFHPQDGFPGPFAREVCGRWTDGGQIFQFNPEGKLLRSIGTEPPMEIGAWWYDYPADPFESPDDSGTGEVLLEEGVLAALALDSQKAERLTIRLPGRRLELIRAAKA
ncbi:glycoside hydrolase family 2 TIM barrel-domain containing protein [Paenibacillus sp. HB172176]|uniref:glycoside hydrolase family 2 TIM barrel-domain containing protein n=1 Tax=Paenibacillus sp. HB172176 TaxID=2493690 RepID=UPI00143A48B5|nr:glycoside hydrolase family 2 TIM barrel-domain containing protein [Paenibacillus sp. HB172176]